jgi:hypothetical protein
MYVFCSTCPYLFFSKAIAIETEMTFKKLGIDLREDRVFGLDMLILVSAGPK